MNKSYWLKRKTIDNHTIRFFEYINIDIIKIYSIGFNNYEYITLFINKDIRECIIFIYKNKGGIKKIVQFINKYMKT